jgi:hypothetical protein
MRTRGTRGGGSGTTGAWGSAEVARSVALRDAIWDAIGIMVDLSSGADDRFGGGPGQQHASWSALQVNALTRARKPGCLARREAAPCPA